MSAANENRLVARLAELVALERGYSRCEARHIKFAAALHDIGKIKIAKSILDKPGKLTADEYEVMKTHTTLGAEILAGIMGELGETARNICLWHHERWDSCGYWGKAADALPAYVHIVSLCDVFIALISERPYKSPWTTAAALEYIRENAGTQFSPELADVLCKLVTGDARVPIILAGKGGTK
jgi:putative two-component system response regulator